METIKKYLVTTWLFKWAYRMGGIESFPLAYRDVMVTLDDHIKGKIEARVREELLAMLTTIDDTRILKVEHGKIYLNNKPIEDNVLVNLQSEANFFKESELWKVMNETIRKEAEMQMFIRSQSEADLQKGKTILFTMKTQNNFIDILTKNDNIIDM